MFLNQLPQVVAFATQPATNDHNNRNSNINDDIDEDEYDTNQTINLQGN